MKKIIERFEPLGGAHCITNALKQLFQYYGFPLSEAMLFGLGEGLDFTYIRLAGSPLVSGRSKILEFEQVLARNLGLSIRFKAGKNDQTVFEAAKKMIDADMPVFIYADMPYLPYLSLAGSGHFGGHAVVLFGYDDEQRAFYVSDRDSSHQPVRTPGGPIAQDHHLVSYEQLQNARASAFRPFPANNKYISEISFSGYRGADPRAILAAVSGVCAKMLAPPAKLKGISGIGKFARELPKWAALGDEALARACTANYFQISGDGGTGGGIFRRLYGSFLLEAAPLLNSRIFRETGTGFTGVSALWDGIAEDLWNLHSRDQLPAVGAKIAAAQAAEHTLLTGLQRECAALLGAAL